MQGIEAITAEIIARAETAAAETVRMAEEAAADKLKALDDRLSAENAARKAALTASAKNVVDRRLTLAGVEARMRKLGAKQALIRRCYEEACVKIAALPAEKYRETFGRMLAKCAEDGATVTVAAADKERLSAEWLKDMSAALHKKMTPAAEYSDSRGGLVVAGETCETDLTLETLIGELENARGGEVVSVLFGEDR